MAKSPIIESIKGKIDRIIAENVALKEHYSKLSGQRDKLKLDNREMTVKISELEKRISILELREGMSAGSGDAKRAKARVNRLMREVDKCIALLNT